MRIHILGISGTFMTGVALLAKQCGHVVTGSDENCYPPMSTQLIEQGIQVYEGYEPGHLGQVDCVLIGNVIKRGNPLLEYVLANDLAYTSGPAWLAENILRRRKVFAIAGTHGKTTTTSMLAWIFAQANLAPGFLIGGISQNFGVSAAYGNGQHFIIEADEYDSAFFDKRPKFIHYRPHTLVLNNLEFDHADIYPNLESIKQQFHYLIRTIPSNGLIIYREEDDNLKSVLEMGCYTKTMSFGKSASCAYHAALVQPDGSEFDIFSQDQHEGRVNWDLLGRHNVDNALAAFTAARQAGIQSEVIVEALKGFKNVKRRLEKKAEVNGIVIYDDFAHHPTAIATTLAGLRAKVGQKTRIITVLEFGSFTMRTGAHKEKIKEALAKSDMIICKSPALDWGLKEVLASCPQPSNLYDNVDSLIANLIPQLKSGDQVLVMSNASFGGIHEKLINQLQVLERK